MTWIHRHDHPSPNSCWGMVPFAAILGIRLGGRTVYHEKDIENYPDWNGGKKPMNA